MFLFFLLSKNHNLIWFIILYLFNLTIPILTTIIKTNIILLITINPHTNNSLTINPLTINPLYSTSENKQTRVVKTPILLVAKWKNHIWFSFQKLVLEFFLKN